jgi:hypothetical protein
LPRPALLSSTLSHSLPLLVRAHFAAALFLFDDLVAANFGASTSFAAAASAVSAVSLPRNQAGSPPHAHIYSLLTALLGKYGHLPIFGRIAIRKLLNQLNYDSGNGEVILKLPDLLELSPGCSQKSVYNPLCSLCFLSNNFAINSRLFMR